MISHGFMVFLVFLCACGTSGPRVELTPEPAPKLEPKPAPKPASKPAAASARFRFAPKRSFAQLTGAGGVLFGLHSEYRVDEGQVERIREGGESLVSAGPASRLARLSAYTLAGKPVALASGKMGAVAVYGKGKWDYRLAPALHGETIGGAWLSQDGAVYAAGTTHALYVRRGDTWVTHRYPAPTDPKIFAVGGGGAGSRIYLLGREGLLWTFQKGRFKVVALNGWAKGQLTKPLDAAWFDKKSQGFWTTNKSTLFAIDCDKGTLTRWPNRMFFDVAHITGVHRKKGLLLLLSSFGKTAMFDGTDWSLAHKNGASSAWIDGGKAQLYRTTTFKGVVVSPVKHPFLGSGEATPL